MKNIIFSELIVSKIIASAASKKTDIVNIEGFREEDSTCSSAGQSSLDTPGESPSHAVKDTNISMDRNLSQILVNAVTPEIDALLEQIISLLHKFQLRTMQNEPMKAKSK